MTSCGKCRGGNLKTIYFVELARFASKIIAVTGRVGMGVGVSGGGG